MSTPLLQRTFTTRHSRSRFVAEHFHEILRGSVCDIGCYEAPLRTLLSGPYTGVDMAGAPDIRLNLERADRLPFEDGSFDCVLCIDVLEHLDNLHAMFDELVRIARRYVLVSLPNAWAVARCPIERGRGDFAHYGLPAQSPEDRHKWFFNLSQARIFLESRAVAHHLQVRQWLITEKPRPALVRIARRLRYPGDRYANRYANTLWAVLEKNGVHSDTPMSIQPGTPT